ncbi:phosphonate metabolism transcriptional regulator PhnF [Ancylobacter amanitiformis]|uniref:GntR family phosphonate transport system transcriptional regulator n=1 Tax=Ancylobacter amanitiformis TaxID=217069 RepID=A0ABU0LM25_9HYPH|nr:phosphonate metabolism transcriptional regulator PhnF [Ancylobacter amanitiformis]MDQ0509732.1 GntR family phosphonate transport system transcriptional regulator [Ancylobacter amanitiformis]
MDGSDDTPMTTSADETEHAAPARGTGVALWKQIVERIELDIAEGRLSPGMRLPTEMELAERFGVNRHTLRRALSTLTEQGIVEATPGRGTFVKQLPIRYPIAARTRFSEIVSGEGRAPGGRLVRSLIEPASATVAQALRLPLGQDVLRIDMVRDADGVPITVGSHWYEATRCRDLDLLVASTGSVTRALEALGLGDYRRLETRVTARVADEEERQLLSLPAGRTVLVIDAINGDARRQPIQYSRARFAADRVQLVVRN